MSIPFEDFFTGVHGYSPFPWQARLATRIVEEGCWPEVLDLPTGSGKTSAIDIALYTLAQRPETFPRRIVLVVDRRVVVDQGADHARKILRAMQAGAPAAIEIADRLRETFAGVRDDDPFGVAVLRGGMPRDEAWAKYPDRPLVALSTVDQTGSRLLFRGYGVSPRMAPIHAGLLGNDTLLLLDEVQLSTAFAETLRAIGTRWMTWRKPGEKETLPRRWAAVRMSATPIGQQAAEEKRFTLLDDDRTHPVLAKRLGAHKLASLQMVRVSGEPMRRRQEFASSCAEAAQRHVEKGARTVVVIVNRVDSARRVFQRLLSTRSEGTEVVLLTGRMRPLDRARILGSRNDSGSLIRRLEAGRERSQQQAPLLIVSTQSLEAGADFDFDALVTECASIDALRQRFGRLDRLGELGQTAATILVRHDQLGANSEDPIYGTALSATWEWLNGIASGGVVDFGIESLPPLAGAGSSLVSPVVHAPVLLPAHIDAWAQTNPRPEPDPEVALWLHGPRRGVPEVQIVWRADVDANLLVTLPHQKSARLIGARLDACPPSSLEAMPVPLFAARAWLERVSPAGFGDVEGETNADQQDQSDAGGTPIRPCVRRKSGSWEIVGDPSQIGPGDTIVVPATYGGIEAGNWSPEAEAPVLDWGDWAQLIHRGRPVVRLDHEVLEQWVRDALSREEVLKGLPSVASDDDADADVAALVREWLPALAEIAKPELATLLRSMTRGPRLIVLPDGAITLVGRRRIRIALQDGFVSEESGAEVITEDDDSSSFIGTEVTLERHLQDVREQARQFAQNVGVPEPIAADIALAAWLHDVGKADPRFQRMLLGGSEVRAALQKVPLAKSSGEQRDTKAREDARRRAQYPRGYRHELLSVAMLEQADFGGNDRDLVLHLVGSHHGWCRPFAPAEDPGPELDVTLQMDALTLRANAAHRLARLDSGVPDRFFALVERYGWWGLAWMEAVMRLADHRASESYAMDTIDGGVQRELARGVAG